MHDAATSHPSSRPSSRPCSHPLLTLPPSPQVYATSKVLVYYHSVGEKQDGQPPRGQRQLKSMRLHGGVGSDACDGSGKSGDGDGYPILCLYTAEAIKSKRRSGCAGGSSPALCDQLGHKHHNASLPSAQQQQVTPGGRSQLLLKFITHAEMEVWHAELSRAFSATASLPLGPVGRLQDGTEIVSLFYGHAGFPRRTTPN